MNVRRVLLVAAAMSLFAGLSAVPSAVGQARAGATSAVPHPDHVVVVVEENRAETQVVGSPDAPYLSSLAASGANFTSSFGVTHPSQPNYLALFSGSTQGLTDDSCPHTYTGPSLGDEAVGAGVGFVGYSEDLPSVGYTGCVSGNYARKHNPWVDFPAIPASANQPFSAFPTDYSNLPGVSFVIPNLQHDMHDGTVAQGDTWLQSNLSGYATWAQTHNSLLIVTFDEDDSASGNRIATIFSGQRVAQGNYAETISHYDVLRTVTDAFGLAPMGTGAPITDVWTPGSGNQSPSAVFTSSCSGLDCSFDATSSADSDGTIASYAWDFGDGASGSGATATHTYATSGTYQVTLTVLDDQGATGSVTHAVSVLAPGAAFAADSFNRTLLGGWGSADVGGAWSLSGSASSFSVSPGVGSMRLAKAGSQVGAYLGSMPRSDADVLARVRVDAVPVGGPVYVTVEGRRVSAGNEYLARVLVYPDKSVTVLVSRLVAGAEKVIGSAVKVPGLTYAAGKSLDVRVQVTGTGPTVVRARVWATGASEPSTWAVSGSDSTAGLQSPGAVGFIGYLSGAVTNAPLTIGVTTLTAQPTTAPANQAPTAVFTSSCSGLACSFDGQGSTDDQGVTGWTWDFGDGTAGTGSTASHAYVTAGTYTVKLTVSDAGSLSNAVSHTITVVAPGAAFASDTFARTVSGGWGSADVGGAWSLSGSASSFSVSPGVGSMRLAKAGSQVGAYLGSMPRSDADVLARVRVDAVPVGGPVYVTVEGRRVSAGNEYLARVLVYPDKSVTVLVSRLVAGAEKVIGSAVKVPGLTYAAGKSLDVRVQVTGTGPTVVRARVWATGASEPSTWAVSGSDSTAGLQSPGAVGFIGYLSGAVTNAPLTIGVTTLTAQPVAGG